MKKLLTKKYLAIGVIALVAIGFLAMSSGVTLAAGAPGVGAPASAPQTVAGQTQTPNGFDCTILGADPCTSIVSFILTVVQGAMGLFIAIAAWLIGIGMALTTTVYSSQATQTGFATTLSIANLAFILAIIVIAIATILHRETYGYKKTLWRLVAMAILVNFGLVITAPIVGFANGMTNYFVAGVTQGASGNNAVVTFSTTLMQKTNAAALQGTVPTSTVSTASNISIGGAVFQTIFSLIFIIIFQGLIVITFLSLGLLLFVRYVFLVVLLILLPLAWVTWIFPSFSHQWSQWWKKFIQWTFFPPAAMFFVWLAMTINTNFNNTVNSLNGPAAAIGTAIGQSNAITGGTSATGILAQIVNSIVVIGIMIGGLLAASKLAEGAGAFAVAQAKNVSGAVQGYVGRQTKKTGRWAYQKSKMPALADKLREGKLGGVEKLPVAGWLARRGASLAGRGMASISTNSKMVEDAKKNVPKSYKDIEKDLAGGGLSNQEKFAWLAEYAKQGKLTENTKIGNQNAHEFFDKNKALFDRYSQGKLRGDADKLFMSNESYRTARREGNKTTMQVELNKFLNDFKKQDSARVNGNALFNENADPNDVEVRLRALAQRPELVPGIYKNLNGTNQQYFDEKYNKLLDQEIGVSGVQVAADKIKTDQLGSQIKDLKDKNEKLQRGRTLAVGRDQEDIDREIAANNDAAKQLQDQLEQINKQTINNISPQVAMFRKARTAFERLIINNASEGPSDDREEKKEEPKGGADKKDSGGAH